MLIILHYIMGSLLSHIEMDSEIVEKDITIVDNNPYKYVIKTYHGLAFKCYKDGNMIPVEY